MNERWISERGTYKAMVSRHIPLWEYVSRLIAENGIKSIVDCGGGIGHAAQFVEPDKYTLYDCSQKMVDLSLTEGRNAVCGDFTTATTSIQAVKGADLVLILAVVEHACTLEPFIKKALEIEPRFILVSFFKGLKPKVGKTVKVKNNCSLRVYAIPELQRTVESLGIASQSTIFSLEKDPSYSYLKHTVFDGLLLVDLKRGSTTTNNLEPAVPLGSLISR